MADTERCGRCGDDIPAALIAMHMASCDAEPDETPTPHDVLIPDEDPVPTDEQDEGGGLAVGPDPDDEFSRLIAGLDDIPVPTDIVNVALLDEAELSSRFNAVRQELLSMPGQMMNPTTQKARDLHSERAAYLVEMRRRGMQ